MLLENIQRYKVAGTEIDEFLSMLENDNGKWVKYEDVKQLINSMEEEFEEKLIERLWEQRAREDV